MSKQIETAIEDLLKYFESGNSIPVDQATIKATSKEIVNLKNILQQLKDKNVYPDS